MAQLGLGVGCRIEPRLKSTLRFDSSIPVQPGEELPRRVSNTLRGGVVLTRSSAWMARRQSPGELGRSPRARQ